MPVRVEPATAALVLDDKPVAAANGSIAVPPGGHVLVARAQGFRERRVEIPAERAADYRLEVSLARIEVEAKPVRQLVSTRKLVGVSLCEGGAVVFGAGLLVTSPDGGFSRLNTALFATGGAVAVVGAALWLTAPDERHPQAMRIVPALGDDHVGLAVAGRF